VERSESSTTDRTYSELFAFDQVHSRCFNRCEAGRFFSTPLSRDLGYKFVNLYRHLRFYFDTASERVCLPMLFCTLGTRFCWKALFILVTTKLSGKILVMSYPSLYCYSTLPDATRCDNSRQTCRSLMCNNETEPKTRLCFSSFGSALNGIFSNTRV